MLFGKSRYTQGCQLSAEDFSQSYRVRTNAILVGREMQRGTQNDDDDEDEADVSGTIIHL